MLSRRITRKQVIALTGIVAAAGVLTGILIAASRDNRPARDDGDGAMAPEVRLICDPRDVDRPCRFEPAHLIVHVGADVRWINTGDVFHTVTSAVTSQRRQPSGLFDHSLTHPGDEFTFEFDAPGTYAFYCRPHSEFMFGTVEVVRS